MYIDLTTIISNDSPSLDWVKSQDNPHIAMGHVGTHLDTYEKSHIPLEFFKSEAIIFDVKNCSEITTNDVDVDLIQAGDFVLLYTGCMERSGYGEPGYFENHPQLSKELIEKLLTKHIRFIGVDCPGIRRHAEHEKADRLCEQHGIYVIENLTNLCSITQKRFLIYTMWLDDEDMTGLRCRVIAECDNTDTNFLVISHSNRV